MKSLTGFLCAAALLAFPLVLDAGTPVKGKVSDASGAPVVGALVFEPGTSNGTMTDENGHYSIELSSGSATISFSLLGYNDITEKVNGRAVVDAVMTDDRQQLEEVVVVGYGVQKRGTLTGSVASINSEKLTKAPADNVANLLGGKLPGLVSRQTTGLPGENQADIYIRGISTTGSSSPLVLVDGVERDFSNLDPSEIQSVTILKDAASAAVYGVKGANGVILVTTRRGDDHKASVTYNGAVTFSNNADMISLLDGPEYAYWHNLATDLDGIAREYSDTEIGYIRDGNDLRASSETRTG